MSVVRLSFDSIGFIFRCILQGQSRSGLACIAGD
jgi:hypothetical protein